MVTTMKAAFQDRGQNEAGAVKLNRAKLQGSHFELGHLNNDLKSMNQISYDYQHYDNKDIKAEQERLMSELRNHHFDLGGQDQDYGTQSKLTYKAHVGEDAGRRQAAFKMADSLQLGDQNANLLKASYYGKEMVQHPAEAYKEGPGMGRDRNADRNSNWSLGHFGGGWESEAKQHFKLPAVDHVGNKSTNRVLKEQLMASNIYNGGGPSRYLSENHSKFDEKNDPNCRGVLDPELVKDLRASHYQIGENGKFISGIRFLT